MVKNEFKIGYEYSRDEVHIYYFGCPYPKKGTGNWTSGYVRPKGTNDLIVFMNIDVAGRTGHDFPNKYDPVNNTITWYGKPKTNSKQKTFKMIKDGLLIEIIIWVHELLFSIILWLISIHILAAIYHRTHHDFVWSSMVPFLKVKVK